MHTVSTDAAAVSDAELGHRALISYSCALAGWSERGAVRHADGVVTYASGSSLPIGGNGAFRVDPSVSPADLIDLADHFFGKLRRGYGIKVRDTGEDDDLGAACAAAGFEAFGELVPQMICRSPLAPPTLPDDVRLVRVDSAQGVAEFTAVNGDAYATYGMPVEVPAEMFDRADAVLADPNTAIVIAYRGEQALATALIFCADGTGSVQWVGTRPEARGMALGSAVTAWVTNEAFERGAATVTLQASTMGAPIYLRLGYETQYHYTEYVRWRTERPTEAPASSD
jgi:ribosomal protein S18 acetylase RimI-like enzyme